jgi:uncharacterized protein YjbI with pentapeptide repeats
LAKDKQSEAEAEAAQNQKPRFHKISDQELQRILAEHKKWIETGGKEGQRADLSNTDLSKRDLHGANLSEAKLHGAYLYKADLHGAHLFKTDLHGAHLTEAKLHGATLIAADLHGAYPIAADLHGAILFKADLHGADLTFANLHGAKLWEADLRADLSYSKFKAAELTRANLRSADLIGTDFSEAKLDHADLTRAIGAQPDKFAYADLTAAKLPEELRNFQEPLRTLEEAARNCRKLFLSTLLACAYSVVAIFSTPVENQLTLPIIQTKVEFDDLLVAMPVVLFCVFVYLHMNLRLLWRRLSRLPAIFPDGRTLTEKAYPWLLIGLVRNYLPTLWEKDKSWGYWFQRLVSILLAWVATPATIALFAVPSFSRPTFWVSYLIAVEFGLCATAALLFWRDADQALKGEHCED